MGKSLDEIAMGLIISALSNLDCVQKQVFNMKLRPNARNATIFSNPQTDGFFNRSIPEKSRVGQR